MHEKTENYGKPQRVRLDRSTGYEYFFDRAHPLAKKNGLVAYHRHVASVKLGRWLRREEVVHHRDGQRANNDPQNLEVMTRQSHTSHHQKRNPTIYELCACCSNRFEVTHSLKEFCSDDCSRKSRRRFDVTKEDLQDLVWKLPISEVAAIIGVSDVAVHKRCKRLGVEKPPQGYWLKNG